MNHQLFIFDDFKNYAGLNGQIDTFIDSFESYFQSNKSLEENLSEYSLFKRGVLLCQ